MLDEMWLQSTERLQGNRISYIIKCIRQKIKQTERETDFGTKDGNKTCQKF